MDKTFLILKNIGIVIFKIILCFVFTLFISVGAGIIFVAKFDWQIILYLILFILVIIGFWMATFVKTKKIKIVYLYIFITFILASLFLPSVRHRYELDICVDTGICTNLSK